MQELAGEGLGFQTTGGRAVPRCVSGLVGACVVLLCLPVGLAAASDWPMWRYDGAHTAASPHELPTQLHLQWVREYSPRVPVWDDPLNQDLMPYDRIFEPVVADGRMFVAFNDSDKVVALDVQSGKELWRFYADGPVRFSPAVWRDGVYFVSDDGYLYCVAAADGQLRWRLRGGPSGRKVLGNRRVISVWPARGGPVVRDGVVYFAASIWPFMGTFIYAVDAETGEVLWLNDRTGPQFIKQPHRAPAFAGVAPQGQLVATAEWLLVPGGRSCPAVLDRETGELVHFDFGGKGQGGSFVAASDSLYFVHTRLRGTMAYRLADWSDAGFRINEPVLDGDVIYAANTPGERDGQPAEAVVQAFDGRTKELLWQVVADGSGDLIKAGSRLYAAGRDAVVAIEPPQGNDPAKVVWSLPVDGRVLRLLAASQRLFAVTLEGKIMAFAADAADPTTLAGSARPIEPQPEAARRAGELLQAAGADEGYALWFGVDDEPLLEALVAGSRLHVVAVDPDREKVVRLRRRFDAAGLYGRRVAVHAGDPGEFKAPPYVAQLLVVGRSTFRRLADQGTLRGLYESVRPYGGVLWVAASGEESQRLAAQLRAARMPNAKVLATPDGVLAVRQGPLPGSAPWTHTYGDIANTVKSNDRRVRLPLGLLWFGGQSNQDVLPRHSHGPSPQVIGGRLFIEGINCLSARDVYTGRVLWKREFQDLGTFNIYYDETYADTPLSTAYNQVHIPGANARGTNYVATEQGVYLAIGSRCVLLDAATGRTVREFHLPPDDGGDRQWAFIGVYENLLLAGTGFGHYSRRLGYKFTPEGKRTLAWSPDYSGSLGLLAFDRHTGEALWKVDARHSFLHNGIVAGGGRIYCLDRLPRRVEEQLRRRGQDVPDGYRIVAFDARTGNELWAVTENVFGTWLSYSQQQDILLQAGAAGPDRSPDESRRGMAAYRAANGSLVWANLDITYTGPCMLHGEMIITNTGSYSESRGAFSLLDGSPSTVENPLTGRTEPWRFTRTYGCNTAVASEYLLTFRSGAAGFYDLADHSGTGNLGGFKSSCTSNLIVADGVLNAPEYTRTCSCAYQNQTSLALVRMPENEYWTYNLFDTARKDSPQDEQSPRIVRLGINFGAPGDRRDPGGTLWLEYPVVGGISPRLDVSLEGDLRFFYRHSGWVSGEGLPWVAASGVEGVRRVQIRLVPPAESPAEEDPEEEEGTCPDQPAVEDLPHTVGLYFLEPDRKCSPGQRVFDVSVQGKKVLEAFDIIKRTGTAYRSLVIRVPHVPIGAVVDIRFECQSDRPPVLCGVEVVRE